MLKRLRRRLPAWIALWAMCFAALAPTLALAAADGETWVEVCTAQGMRWVSTSSDAGGDAGPAPDLASGHFERCPYCSLAAQPLAPPPAASSVLQLTPLRQGPPPRFLSAARTSPVWCTAQARAPPRAS